jgi:hypothetical protein
MKRIIFTLLFGMSLISGYSQITITKQPDSPTSPQACEGNDVIMNVTATPVGLTYQWEVKFKTLLPWTAISPIGLMALKGMPGFSNVDILNYTTNTITIKNVNYQIDSVQFRCKIVQIAPANTATTTEPYVRVFALPGIDKVGSVLKGCEPAQIQIKINNSYNPLGLVTCQYDLKQGATTVSSITDNNPLTIASKFPITVDSTSQYIFVATNKLNGTCVRKDTLNVHVQKVFQQEKIGLVTFDLATNKWKVIWDKTPNEGSQSCNIIKQISTNPKTIGAMPYTSNYGIFVDDSTPVNAPPNPYKIQLVDTCGHISGFSPSHKPMFLQSAVDSGKNSLKFNWTPYSGFSYAKFYIHRSSKRDSIFLKKNIIDSVANTDTSYTLSSPIKNSYYAISVNLPTPLMLKSALKAESGPYTQSLSNISEFQISADDEIFINNLSVSPNPFSNAVQVNVSLDKAGSVTIEIINAVGAKIIGTNLGMQDAGDHSFQLAVGDDIANGLYLIKVSVNGSSKIVKAIHQK